jgi:ElaA protein
MMMQKEEEILWSAIHFNDLSLDQLYDLYALRTEVFVVEQDCPYQEVDQKDRSAIHLLGYSKEGELALVARVLPPGISYKELSFGRVAVKMTYRSKGYGHQLNKKLIEYITSRFPGNAIRISAQSHLKGFYESSGFKKVSEEYDEDGIPHIEMIRLAE